MDDPLLMIPGPTPLPPEVRAAMSAPLVSHRSPRFLEAQTRVRGRLQKLLGTAGEAVLMPGSGTGAMEAGIVNCFSPGEDVVVGIMGMFGQRFLAQAQAFGLSPRSVSCEPGRALQPERIAEAVTADTRGVLLTYSDTSTGVLLDLQAAAAAVRAANPDALIVVDAVSALGAAPLPMDAWGVDVVCAGGQKALMSPPGLAVMGVSPRALEANERAALPRYFWDWKTYLARVRAGAVAYTPAIPALLGLDAALSLIEQEGTEAIFRRHTQVAAQCRAGLRALEFAPLASEADASPTCTTSLPPAGVAAETVMKGLLEHGIEIAAGLGPMAGKAVRVGHMGYVGETEVARLLAALREVVAAARGAA